MATPKDSSNLSSDINSRKTSKRSVSSRPQLDSVVKKIKLSPENIPIPTPVVSEKKSFDGSVDDNKRLFLKVAGVAGLGLAAGALFPKGAEAYVAGSTPTSNVVGLKDDSNTRINPATEETLSSLVTGQGVTKLTTSLSSSGTVRTPGSGNKIRVYATRFSLTADAASVSFRFTAGGTDYEKYVSPKTGGLYGSNNHPNYTEGGVDEVLYCVISGTTTVQINIDYLEV